MTAWRVRLATSRHERAAPTGWSPEPSSGSEDITDAPQPHPVLIEGDAASSRGAFVEALRSVRHPVDYVYVDGERWTVNDREPLTEAVLRNGSLITETGTSSAPTLPGTYLVAVGGADSGRSIRLTAGTAVEVGRTADGFAINDPLMSGRHFSAMLEDRNDVRVTDLGSKNGMTVEGEAVDSALLAPGCLLHTGASLFAAVTLGDGDRATLLGTTPTGVNLQRQFREAVADLPAIETAPKEPSTRDANSMGSAWWRSLTPLVTAVGFAVMFGRWQFLLIAAFTPIVFTVDSQRRKRKMKRDQVAEQERYERDLRDYETKLAGHRGTEARRARQRHAGGGLGALYARFRHRRIWERSPADPDFSAVTLGYAALPSSFETRDEQKSHSRTLLWQAPLTISLTHEGPLSITGPVERANAVARSLVIDLVFAHAPGDLNLWVITDESRAGEWSFVQWLPHAFTADGGARLAATPGGRSVLMQALRGLIDARREQAGDRSNGLILPVQVVVLDGVANLETTDLTEILRHGPDVGVFGIVTDASIVPEGIRAEVQLGRFDDECAYRSVATPRVDDVSVSQLSTSLALEAALALAPLEAFSARAASRPIAQVYFSELVQFGQRTPAEQVDFWRLHSPRTNVPVGVAMDGAMFNVDIVTQGPHGLIGGMTRSGKTEFLKTWFASLAMHNHPDDLAIAIVDFKGGVDHKITANLPHVIALATNQNIDLFERTITLLTAEHERREHMFLNEAGVATIEGYRTARDDRPELPPIPRLLVVVDEFAELLDTPEGKAQVGRLESIARIGAGLGVHLLLLTQMFNNALPPTIDGQAGLRVCFKVQNGNDSKIVIKSAAAAGISSATKGRAFARFQGGDLVEFQSARVGNEARHLVSAGTTSELAAHFVTLDSLTRPPAPPELREVPNHQQDLHHIVEVLRQAALLDGYPGGAVPWPNDLPAQIGLAELGDQLGDVPLVIGVADDPEHQRIRPVAHSFADAVVAYAGSAGSCHHDALLTTATQLALSSHPADLHIYGVDLVGQGLALISALPHVGSIATRDDATGLRILNWLVTEAASRRAVIARQGAADFAGYVQMGGNDLPQIVLFVLGADRMFLHGEGSVSPLLGPMTTVVNEVVGTGIQVVFSGSHPMLSNRLGTTASRRLVFAANDPGEYPATVSKPLRAQLTVPYRCVDSSSDLLCQIARVCPDDVNAGDVYGALADGITEALTPAGPRRTPRRFTKAPWPLRLTDVRTSDLTSPVPGIEMPLPFGVRPDTGELLWLDPLEDGSAHRIIGPPKSGRSNALAALAVLAHQVGWKVIASSASRRSPLLTTVALNEMIVPVAQVIDLIGDGVSRPTLLLIDDAHRLDDDFPWKKLATIETGLLVTVVAGSTEALTRSTGVMRTLNAPNGVALMPSRTRDAGGVGINVIDEGWVIQPLPGIGVAGIAGEAHRVQFPLIIDT